MESEQPYNIINSVEKESFGLIFTWRGELSVIGSQDFKDFVTNSNVPIWRSIACPNICTISKPSHEEHLLDFITNGEFERCNIGTLRKITTLITQKSTGKARDYWGQTEYQPIWWPIYIPFRDLKFKSKGHLLEIIRSYRAFYPTDSVDVVTNCTRDRSPIVDRITKEPINSDVNQIEPYISMTTNCEEPQELSDHFDLLGDIDTTNDSFFHISELQPGITSLSNPPTSATSISSDFFSGLQPNSTNIPRDGQIPHCSLAELCSAKTIFPVATIPLVAPVVFSKTVNSCTNELTNTDQLKNEGFEMNSPNQCNAQMPCKQEIQDTGYNRNKLKFKSEEEREDMRQVKKKMMQPIDLTSNSLPKEENTCKKVGAGVWKILDGVKLLEIDRDVLESKTKWITDDIINGTQKLLKRKYPVPGLQDTLLGQTLHFDVMRNEFVQVLHSGGNHWVTVSTVGCPPSTVNVFDSISSNIPTRTKEQICALLMSSHDLINLQFVNIQKQNNAFDCGLFVLAFATSLCAGEKILQFDQTCMRSHLLRCLEEEDIKPFPSMKVPIAQERIPYINRTDIMKIYCICRSQDGGKMIACDRCDEWYHYKCVKISKKVSKRSKHWYCTKCNI